MLAKSPVFGSGMYGTVFARSLEDQGIKTALKIHENALPFARERDAYVRLQSFEIRMIEGHHVPQLVNFDDELLAIEMSVVARPFELDFGDAYLDRLPDYGEEIMAEWSAEKEEQFGENWPAALRVLKGLRHYGI
jgi:hypothetical protein